jgi:hypothetical protein
VVRASRNRGLMETSATTAVLPFRLPATLAVAALLILAVPNPAPAQCPESSLWGCGDIWNAYTTWPAAMLDWESPTGISTWAAGDSCPLGCYDLREGVLEVRGWGNPYSNECGAWIDVADRYWVVGATGEMPLHFTAEFWVDGATSGSNGSVSAILREPADPTGARERVIDGPVHLRMTIPLEHGVGEEFVLFALLTAGFQGPGGYAHAVGTIRFSGLPAGAYVMSCQGYDLPVPTVPTTWGKVKSLYR